MRREDDDVPHRDAPEMRHRNPRLHYVVGLMLIIMILSSITLSVQTLRHNKIVRVLDHLESRVVHLNNKFREAGRETGVAAIHGPVEWADDVAEDYLSKLEDYKKHRSKHRKEKDIRPAIQKTDSEFHHYVDAYEAAAAGLAGWAVMAFNVTLMNPLVASYEAAFHHYIDSLDDTGVGARRAVQATAIVQLVVTSLFCLGFFALVVVAVREARTSQELASSSKALIDNLGVAAFVVRNDDGSLERSPPTIVIVDASTAALRVFGYASKRDIIGKSIDLLLPNFDSDTSPVSPGQDNNNNNNNNNNDDDDTTASNHSSSSSSSIEEAGDDRTSRQEMETAAPLTSSPCCADRIIHPSPRPHRKTEGPSAIRGVTTSAQKKTSTLPSFLSSNNSLVEMLLFF